MSEYTDEQKKIAKKMGVDLSDKDYVELPEFPGIRFSKREAEDMFKPRDPVKEPPLPQLSLEQQKELSDFLMHNHKKKDAKK